MPCYDPRDGDDRRSNEEELCQLRSIVVKMYNDEELTKAENEIVAKNIKDHLKHRQADKQSRLAELDKRIHTQKSKIGFVMDDVHELREVQGNLKKLDAEYKRIANLTDKELMSDRFCDRIVV
jgi:hypothetical protein